MPASNEILEYSQRKSEGRVSVEEDAMCVYMEYTILKTVWLILLDDMFLTEKQIGGIKL